ncbi:MAG: indolepyruvate oxidoreductase subunit beta [Nitrospirota bacterium]
MRQQILLSGVGGQGILFITRLLAEAAIYKGFPVLTSETHGMAQRGGTVLSHLKVGPFTSPLIRPGQADGLILLKAENLARHRFFLKPGGWIVVNAPSRPEGAEDIYWIDADTLAEQTGNHQSVNLIVLGCALSRVEQQSKGQHSLFYSLNDVTAVLRQRLAQRERLLNNALHALTLGAEEGK